MIPGPSVGAFTGLDRTTWARIRSSLLSCSPINTRALDLIESSLFVLCLDDTIAAAVEDECKQFLVAPAGVHNRWFDKLCLIVDPRGYAGCSFEHSGFDGMFPLSLPA